MGERNKNHKLTINHTFYSGIIRGAVAKELCKSIYFERHLWHTKDWLSHCKCFPLCCFFPIIRSVLKEMTVKENMELGLGLPFPVWTELKSSGL